MINNNYNNLRYSNNTNKPSFGMRVVYYNEAKKVPTYVQRILNDLKLSTQNIDDSFELTYNGHKVRNFKFTLSDENNQKSVSNIFDRDIDFLDHKSFKYLGLNRRTQKLNQRVQDLRLIVNELYEKLIN